MSEETIKEFTKRIDMFNKGFEMITKNMNTQLEKIAAATVKLEENTAFMPKIMKSNKSIKKNGEKLQLIVDALMARLDSIAKDSGMM